MKLFAAAVLLLTLLDVAVGRKCCLPYRYELGMEAISFSGKDRIVKSNIMAMDYYNKRAALVSSSFHGSVHSFYRIVIDYKAMIGYSIHGSSCTTFTPSPYNQSCIPDSATKIARYYIGPQYQPLFVTLYKFGTNYFSLTDGCIPVDGVSYGSGLGDVYSTSFYNFTLYIKDEGIFYLPPSCKHANSMPLMFRHGFGLMGFP